MRSLIGIGLALLSGILVMLTFTKYGGFSALVFIAFVPMFVAHYRVMPRRLSAVPVFITAFFYWKVIWDIADGLLPGQGYLVWLAALVFALVCAAFAIPDRAFAERTNFRWMVVQLPLWWVGLDLLFQDNVLFGSNGWVAYRLAEYAPMIQTVSLTSTPALSFLIFVVNGAVALAILKACDGVWQKWDFTALSSRVVAWSTGLTAVALAIWIGASLSIFNSVNSERGDQVRVAAVQPSTQLVPVTTFAPGVPIPSDEEDAQRNAAQQIELTDMTRQAAASGAVLAVWPEKVLNYDVSSSRGDWIAELSAAENITIVVGYMTDWPSPATPNLAAVFTPDEGYEGFIYKVHPVIAADEEFDTPEVFRTFDTPFGQLGVIICFDHDFPNSSPRLETLVGSQIIAVPAYDWASIADLRWQSLVFRAAENRVPFVKGETGYDSAIVNANAELQVRDAAHNLEGRPDLLVADVNLGPRNSPFLTTGGYPFMGLVLVLVVIRYGSQLRLWWRGRSDSSTNQ